MGNTSPILREAYLDWRPRKSRVIEKLEIRMAERGNGVVVRLIAVCVVCGLVALVGDPGGALADESSPLDSSSSSYADSLVVPGVEQLVGGQAAEARAARRASPEAVAAREASSSTYENLSLEGAEKLAGEAYPRLIDEPSGGPPRLGEGAKIIPYPTDYAATLELPGGKHGVISSQAPIATEASDGQRVPIDPSLIGVNEGFQVKVPAAGAQVRAPKRLGEGPRLSEIGVSLTPVDEQGTPLNGSAVLDGASVFYGDSEVAGLSDVDTVVKPNTFGFSEETLLRSQRSPQALFFKVGLPEGASLVQEGSGSVEVVDGGEIISSIAASNAIDAEGTVVPTSLKVSGEVLEMSVDHSPGQYRMPILVDPTVVDKRMILVTKNSTGNVVFGTDSEAFEAGEWMYEGLRVAVDEYSAKATEKQFGYLESIRLRKNRGSTSLPPTRRPSTKAFAAWRATSI